MVKISGSQTIPASMMLEYRGNLTEVMPNGVVRKRYPFRRPAYQAGGYRVSEAQTENRNKFLAIKNSFSSLAFSERAAWYSAAGGSSYPDWYFNYFIKSGFLDVMGHFYFGCAMISRVQHYFLELQTDGTLLDLVYTVNPLRCFVLLNGEAHFQDIEQQGTDQAWWIAGIKPILNNLFTSQISVMFSSPPDSPANVVIEIIEYL